LYKKMRDRLKNGFFFGLATVLFVTARFIIEFVKENQVGFEEGMKLNMGQILSIPFIIIGIYFMGKNLTKSETEYKTSH
ncbi:MAG TPA: prolipoprotein diacylglyceryl transferase family protein, partial [Flavobacterium sp.]|nr:prolipoprotein diacylglyceryl transferase family protein [Flavobacterium sp.]